MKGKAAVRDKVKKWSFFAIYAYILVCFVPGLIGMEETIGFTYSMVGVGTYFILMYFLKHMWERFWITDGCRKWLLCVFSFVFLLLYSWGRMLDAYGYIALDKWDSLLMPFGVAPFGAMILYHVYEALHKKLPFEEDEGRLSNKEKIGYALFLITVWGIVLLGVYPGFFVYDAIDEINEVITRQFTTHHPLFHVLYMGGVVQAGYKILGSYNLGIFCFTLFQMLIFVAGIIYAADRMRSFGCHRYLCRGMIVFMGLFPIYPMIVLGSCKDSLFALVTLLWVVTTYEWFKQPGKYCKLRWVILSVMLCLLRNNAIYALVVTGILLIIFVKQYRKQIAILFVLSILASTVFSKGMAWVLHAQPAGNQELLTVPIQQLARTHHLSKELFAEEDLDLLYQYLPEENLERYRPKLSDSVKIGFNNELYEQDSMSFIKLWIKMGLKAPMSYINAWLMTSYGYWYPDTVIDVYEGNQVFTFTYEDNCYYGFETEQPGSRESKIPMINEFYRKLSLEIYKEKLPVISLLFSPGFLLWGLLFIMGYMIIYRGIRSIMPYSFLLLVVATLLLGPTYLPRYVFFLWMALPFVIGDMCKGADKTEPAN